MTLKGSQRINRHYLFNTIILFFSIFSINLVGMPTKPRNIAMSFAAILLILNLSTDHGKKVLRLTTIDTYWLASLVFIVAYTIFISLINNVLFLENSQNELALTGVINYFIFVGLYVFIVIPLFHDDLHFCRCLTIATTIQAVIVIASFLLPFVRSLLENIQTFSFDRYNFRIVGLGIAGASGSVYLATGLLSNTYMLLFSTSHRLWLWLSFFIIFIAIAFVGRTGLYVGLFLLASALWGNSNNLRSASKNIIYAGAGLVALVLIGATIYSKLPVDMDLYTYTYERMFEGFRGSQAVTVTALQDMNSQLPPISVESFWGTGVTRGYSSTGLLLQHDGGYAKRYMGIGLFGAVISYLAFSIYCWKLTSLIDKSKKRFILLCLVVLYIIEYKEPFIFMLAYPFVLIILAKLAYKKCTISPMSTHTAKLN